MTPLRTNTMFSFKSLTAAVAAAAAIFAGTHNISAMAPSTDSNKDVLVDLNTTMGDIRILLYGDTPRHLENFVKLVDSGFYDGVLFHRVINDFMVQTGDPTSKKRTERQNARHGRPRL